MSQLANDNSARIAELNDQHRTRKTGEFTVTEGVAFFGLVDVSRVIKRVIEFDNFNEDNDPYGEHDFGSFKENGHLIFWKIDYYDEALKYGSNDPADPNVTTRVLTIMLASEY